MLMRRALSPVWIILLIGSFPTSSLVAQNTVAGNLAAAALADQAGKYGVAAHYYQSALSQAAPDQAAAAWVAEARAALARDYFLLHRYNASLKAAGAALRTPSQLKRSSLAEAYLVVGMDELALNSLSGAIEHLQCALALNPDSGTARLALGDAYARSNRLEEAATAYRAQLKRTPAVADAWYKLGIVYSRLAAQTVANFEARHPGAPVIQRLIAERFLEREDGAQALRVLLPVLRANPRLPDVHADLGLALFSLGHTDEAVEQFEAEVAEDPDSPRAQWGLAEAAVLAGHWQEASARLTALKNSNPNQLQELLESAPSQPLRDAWQKGQLQVPHQADPAARLWATWLDNSGVAVRVASKPADSHDCERLPTVATMTPGRWLSTACYEKLRTGLERRASLTPAQGEKLAEADFRLGDYEASRAAAERLSAQQPGDPWAVEWIGRSYEELAYECFRRLASLNSNSARVYQMLAQLDANRFRWNRAEREYLEAIRLEPNLPDLHLGLGTVYWQAHRWADAERELRITLLLDPASPVANYELGDALVEQHRWGAAVTHLRKAIGNHAVSYRARLDLAQAEAETGSARQAISDLLPVASEDQDGVLHYRLAMLYRMLLETKQAHASLAESERLRRASASKAQLEIQQAEQEARSLQLPSK